MKMICLIALLASTSALADPYQERYDYPNYVETHSDVSMYGPSSDETPAPTMEAPSKKPRCTEYVKHKTRFMVCTNKY